MMAGLFFVLCVVVPAWLGAVALGLAIAVTGALLARTRRAAGLVFLGTGVFMALGTVTFPIAWVVLADTGPFVLSVVVISATWLALHVVPVVGLAEGTRRLTAAVPSAGG